MHKQFPIRCENGIKEISRYGEKKFHDYLSNIFNNKLPTRYILKRLEAKSFFPTRNPLEFGIFALLKLLPKKIYLWDDAVIDVQVTEEQKLTCWFEQSSPHGQVPFPHSMLSIRFKHWSPQPKQLSDGGLQWQTMV